MSQQKEVLLKNFRFLTQDKSGFHEVPIGIGIVNIEYVEIVSANIHEGQKIYSESSK
jgi:hypothetical protein